LDQPFKDPRELEKTIAKLEERLSDAEDEIQILREGYRNLALLLDAVRESSINTEHFQNRLEAELQRHRIEIQRNSSHIQEILQSRIWRALVSAAGLMLRLGGKAGPVPVRSTPVAAGSTPEGLPTAVPAPVRAPQALRRAAASRHAGGLMATRQWNEVLGKCIAALPAAGAAAQVPRISIITPAWNTQPSWLAEAAISVLEQSSGEWEWCIVDDASTKAGFHRLFPILQTTSQIKVRSLERNRGISGATNEGLRLASAEYVCFLDHDDMLAPTAIAECLEALDQGLDAVYTDSDKVDESGIRREPFYKPDWSPEYFRGVMYIGHLLCVRRDLALEIGGFDSRYDGVQDFEFMLRYSERTQRIGHISEVLYHWRAVRNSVASSSDAKGDLGKLQCTAVQEQLTRLHLPAAAEAGPGPHRVQIVPAPRTNGPCVSIIIPTKDAADLLDRCLTSILEKTAYSNFEIVCVDNDTTDARALRLMQTRQVKRVAYSGSFNFSRANNLGIKQARGEVLVLMNNDIEVITASWIDEMLYYALQKDVGAVGGMLLYPDKSVQHAGVVLGCRGTADHVLRHAPEDSDGYAGSLACAHEVSAVTAACLMVQREKFERAGGFNEYYHTIYQDVDLCLQLRSQGLRNIFTPRARFFHLESPSRGRYYDLIDRNLLLDRWGETIAASDPYYNRNLDVEACDYSLKPEPLAQG
jgi:O-antigen biosynthesis protein